MPNLTIQRLIYRSSHSSRVNRALDAFGKAVNKVVNPLGLHYATGLTRNKAALFYESSWRRFDDMQAVKERLITSSRPRAHRAVLDDLYIDMKKGLFRHSKFKKNDLLNAFAMIKQFFSPEQAIRLLDLIRFGTSSGYSLISDYNDLLGAIEKTRELLSSDQAFQVLYKIAEKFQYSRNNADVFKYLPEFIKKTTSIYDHEQILELLDKILEKYSISSEDPTALRNPWSFRKPLLIKHTDLELWKNPAFKLISMTDKSSNIVNGFMHVFEIEIDGKKYWTLPGIEPSTEFIGTIDPLELYDRALEQVIELAQTKGLDIQGIFIPTDKNIYSNRSEIQKIIKDKKYPTKNISPVHWSSKVIHDFSEVFVVWER